MPPLRKPRGPAADADTVTATKAKNEFGRILDRALRGQRTFITRHGEPKAVVLSVEEFNHFSRKTNPGLDALSREFDAMFARMQTPKARVAMQAAFEASPEELGRAAVEAARKQDRK